MISQVNCCALTLQRLGRWAACWGVACLAAVAATPSAAWARVAVGTTTVEHARNPQGIDLRQPRLSWTLVSEDRGQSQSAYQIQVASTAGGLEAGRADLWDSGKVATGQSLYVPYGGKALTSSQECYWRVRAWDQDGNASQWSKVGMWTMGLLDAKEWQGQWIGYNPVFPRQLPEKGVLSRMNWDGASWFWTGEGDAAQSVPAGRRYFKWTFDVPKKPAIRKAYFRGTADGSYKFYLNVPHVPMTEGEDYRHPGEVEITNTLRPGRNTVGVEVLKAKAGPAAWACKIAVELEDGTIVEKTPEAASVVWTGKMTAEQVAKWLTPKTDVTFQPAKAIGEVGVGPWGKPEFGYLPGWNQTAPNPLLRKSFTVEKPLKRAVVYSCGLGCHELYCNGKRIGDEVLDPAFTRYNVSDLYVTHDITNLLQQGPNTLGAMLGNGWYNMTTLIIWDFQKAVWRDRPKLLLQLRLEYQDGSVQNIVTDGSWKAAPSPILADSIHNGEYYDARAEQPGWTTPEFNDAAWKAAEVMAAPKGALRPQTIEPIRITQTVKLVKIAEPQSGVYIFDLGQNIVGHARLRVSGPRGSTVTLIYGEKLKDNGLVDRHLAGLTFSGSWQEDNYILRGAKGGEEWEARFTYHGFRYVEAHGLAEKPTLETLDGRVVHTDFALAGGFECSDAVLNAVQQATLWTYRGNFQGFPSDCPTREKKGWTGDAHLPSEQAMWNFDNAAGYFKWLRDIREVQDGEGRLKTITPTDAWGGEESDWNVAVILIPWNVYLYTGDAKILEENYAAMRSWIEFYVRTKPDCILVNGVGDWVSPGGPNKPGGGVTPFEVTSTAYYHTAAELMSRIAKVLGKGDDAARYGELADKIEKAFDARFLGADGTVSTGSQTAQACALYLGVIPADQQASVFEKLVEKIHAANDHHATGYHGTKAIYRVLSDNGQHELAYKLVTQKDSPSYGYWIAEGFTTLNEMWPGGNKAGRGGSNNHPWSADISAWFYQYIAGLNADAQEPGFKHTIIRPMVLAELSKASAWHNTPYGRLSSSWRTEGGAFVLDVEVPVNTTATVYVPGKNVKADGQEPSAADHVKVVKAEANVTTVEIGSGKYSFRSEYAPAKP